MPKVDAQGEERAEERRHEGRPVDQLTPRGARTRAALIEAAGRVFERDGFLGARITDIAEEAGVAHGTFYTYFPDKLSVFAAVVERLQSEFLHDDRVPRPPDETVYDAIRRVNRHYYDTYRGRGRMMGILEQVATFDEDLRAVRREARRKWVERNERAIRRWQAQGLCDERLDAHYAASILGSMVDRSVYVWLVLGEPHDPDVAVETMSALWANALGLPVPADAGLVPARTGPNGAKRAARARPPRGRTTTPS